MRGGCKNEIDSIGSSSLSFWLIFGKVLLGRYLVAPSFFGGEGCSVKDKQNYFHKEFDWKPISVLLVLATVWGANMATIKIAEREIAPLFMAGTRSLVATVGLYIWMRVKGLKAFPAKNVTYHGLVVGLLFGTEFGLIYMGLQYTLASRVYILLYTAPFFAALGAHYFLGGDRLTPWKAAGLIIAFCGILVLFLKKLGTFSADTLPGDIMALTAGAMWGGTTVYIKRFLAHRTEPLQTLFYQVLFSVPLLFCLSWLFESPLFHDVSVTGILALAYQCIIVAFLSYLVWFELVHRYQVSLLHAFSFFTPVLGVLISGVIMLGEPIGASLIVALVLVSIGMVLVNKG
ncbi:MAG: EamA/RhaT family transporter [Deltaproteobacteria bacterium]|nr:MAG: EamA/RhaT family transporter [Deltaproteobacteria bacterium]